MLHDVVQHKKFYTLVLQKCLTRSISLNTRNRINEIKDEIVFLNLKNPEIRLKYDNDAKYYVYLYKHFANIKAVVHTHSTNTVAWAQAGRSLPVYGTTHANTFYSEVPITRHLTNEEVTELRMEYWQSHCGSL